MPSETILDQLIKDGTLSQVLQRSDTPADSVKAFKQMLYQMGFDEVLDPKTKKIDGTYGDATASAVCSFCAKNNIISNGDKVTEAIAKAINMRYASLPDMLQLYNDLQGGQIEKKYFKGSTDTKAVTALQQLLHDLGFEKELDWDNNRRSGIYDESTANAVKAYMAKQNAPPKEDTKEGKADPVLKDEDGISKSDGNVLEHLLKKGGLTTVLKKSDIPKLAVQKLQEILHKLGFGKELGQEFEKLDGKYGAGVVKAVKAFCEKNGVFTDGLKITQSVAHALIKRLDALPFMHQLLSDLRGGTIEQKYFKGSKSKVAISALQAVLNDLGLGKELNWAQKGNHGIFDKGLISALKSHFNLGWFKHPKKATPNMINKVLKDAGKKYGPDWTDHVKQLQPDKKSVLTTYTASNIQGKPLIANVAFVPLLERINGYAVKHNVQVKITNSYRRDTFVPGAIVPPAAMSNHKVGHAIDMNLLYGDGKTAISTDMFLTNKANWPAPVAGFLNEIRNDPSLRWGGDFHSNPDPVHIDDDLNHRDPQEWHKQRELTVKAFDEGRY